MVYIVIPINILFFQDQLLIILNFATNWHIKIHDKQLDLSQTNNKTSKTKIKRTVYKIYDIPEFIKTAPRHPRGIYAANVNNRNERTRRRTKIQGKP